MKMCDLCVLLLACETVHLISFGNATLLERSVALIIKLLSFFAALGRVRFE